MCGECGMKRVYIAYYPEDSADFVEQLTGRLSEVYGRANIVRSDEAESRQSMYYRLNLNQAVRDCNRVLVVIGRNWTTMTDDYGRWVLQDEDDPVRLALEAAFDDRMDVVIVRLDGADLPDADMLPQTLKPLLNCTQIDARTDAANAAYTVVEQVMQRRTIGAARQARNWQRRIFSKPMLFIVIVLAVFVVSFMGYYGIIGGNWRNVYQSDGRYYLEEGDYEAALVEYNRAIGFAPDDATLYYERAVVHFEMGNYQLALTDVTRAVELEPDNDEYRLAQGHLYFGLRQYDNAYDAYSAYLSLLDDDDEADPDVLTNMAAIESQR